MMYRLRCAACALLSLTITCPALTLPFSTYLGGQSQDYIRGVAVDSQGNTYLCGETASTNFPLVNAFDTTFDNTEGFVMKIGTNGQIIFSTFLGGGGSDSVNGIAVDAASNIYVTGSTGDGFAFPYTNGFQATPNVPNAYAFVTKFGPAGTNLIYSSYLGGTNGANEGRSIAVDAAGNAYVAGWTLASAFPAVNPAQSTNAGGRDAFITKVAAAGTNLIYSTFLGATNREDAYSIAVDESGNAYVVGDTRSSNFPTFIAFDSTFGSGGYDGFVASYDASGARRFATYIGGGSEDHFTGIALDAGTNIYVCGYGQSFDLPITNAIQPQFAGNIWDAYITAFKPSGTQLLFSTYFGGAETDWAFDLDVDRAGNIYLVGNTESPQFSVTPSRPSGGGVSDAYVLKLLAGGQQALYFTYLGGSGDDDSVRAVAAQLDGTAHVGGETTSLDFPLANAIQVTNASPDTFDGFLTRIKDEPVVMFLSNNTASAIAGWNTYSGLTYKAQANSNLVNGAWKDVNLPVKATVGACCMSATQSVSDSIQFYRAVVTDPLLCTNTYASCSGYQDQTAPGSNRVVIFDAGGFSYSPKCLRIKVGQSVTFSGTFSSHPFNWSCQQSNGVTTNTPPTGSSGVFTFPMAGYYSYYCGIHGVPPFNVMRGSIEVVP